MIEILKCSISRAWYQSEIGSRHKIRREDKEYYWVRLRDGQLNLVKKEDALVLSQLMK